MTTQQVRDAASATCPRIRKQDCLVILKKFAKRGLTRCMNPDEPAGRLWYWTARGRRLLKEASGITVCALPRTIDWHVAGKLARSSTLRMVLREVARRPTGTTATEVYRKTPKTKTLRDVLLALQQLEAAGLVDSKRVKKYRKRRLKEYRLGEGGQEVLGVLT